MSLEHLTRRGFLRKAVLGAAGVATSILAPNVGAEGPAVTAPTAEEAIQPTVQFTKVLETEGGIEEYCSTTELFALKPITHEIDGKQLELKLEGAFSMVKEDGTCDTFVLAGGKSSKDRGLYIGKVDEQGATSKVEQIESLGAFGETLTIETEVIDGGKVEIMALVYDNDKGAQFVFATWDGTNFSNKVKIAVPSDSVLKIDEKGEFYQNLQKLTDQPNGNSSIKSQINEYYATKGLMKTAVINGVKIQSDAVDVNFTVYKDGTIVGYSARKAFEGGDGVRLYNTKNGRWDQKKYDNLGNNYREYGNDLIIVGNKVYIWGWGNRQNRLCRCDISNDTIFDPLTNTGIEKPYYPFKLIRTPDNKIMVFCAKLNSGDTLPSGIEIALFDPTQPNDGFKYLFEINTPLGQGLADMFFAPDPVISRREDSDGYKINMPGLLSMQLITTTENGLDQQKLLTLAGGNTPKVALSGPNDTFRTMDHDGQMFGVTEQCTNVSIPITGNRFSDAAAN